MPRIIRKSAQSSWLATTVCLATLGASLSFSLFAQQEEDQPRLGPSVTPSQVDRSYDPLRDRKVNPILMIRDRGRADGALKTDPTRIPDNAQVTELPPRRQQVTPRTTSETITRPSSTMPQAVPTPATRPSITPRNTTPPQPRYTPPSTGIPQVRPVPGAEPAPAITPPPPPPQPRVTDNLPRVRPVPGTDQPPALTLPPDPRESLTTRAPEQTATSITTTEITTSEETLVSTSTELPQDVVAERIDVTSNPGFVDFDELPTGEYLDEDDYKTYFDAGWSILVQSQVEVVEDIAKLRETVDDRDNYLTTGMAMLARQQDVNTTRLNDMEDKIAELEATRAPAQDDNLYSLTPLEEGEEEITETVSTETTTTSTEVTSTTGSVVTGGEASRESELEYLITLLDDIIANTNKYLFWTGYLPEAGPSPLRFAEAKFVVNRRDLIPLTTPKTEGVNMDELFASKPEDELIKNSNSSKGTSTKRPAYEGNMRELSRDQVIKMLQSNAAKAQDVKVHFQIPNQTRAQQLDTPGSQGLYSTE